MRFCSRARVQTNDVFHRRIWTSTCGRYRISEFRRLLEGGSKLFKAEFAAPLSDHGDAVTWLLVSSHRRREPAMRVCVEHARAHGATREKLEV